MNKTIAIVGAGPGVGRATALHFGRADYRVLLISRQSDKLHQLIDELAQIGLNVESAIADVTDSAALTRILRAENTLAVLHYNAFAARAQSVLLDTPTAFQSDFDVNVGGLLTAVQAGLPALEEQQGSILVTGGGLAQYPHPDYASLSVGKAAQANLANSLSQALQPKGIYVGLLQINGFVSEQDAVHNPANIASQFWQMNDQRTAFFHQL